MHGWNIAQISDGAGFVTRKRDPLALKDRGTALHGVRARDDGRVCMSIVGSAPDRKPRFTVCLAVYNGLPWLEEQARTILDQQDVDVRVVVSVDPSTDGSAEWCARLAATEPRWIVLPGSGPARGAAQNFFRALRAVDLAGCDYVSLADQDDRWKLDKLSRAAEVIARTGVDGYSSDVIAFWADGRSRLIRKAQPQRRWDHLFESPGPGCTFVLRPALVNALQSWLGQDPETLADVELHDWLIYAFARCRLFRWQIDERPGLYYRQHATNVFGANAGWSAFRQRLSQSLGGWYFRQIHFMVRAIGIENEKFVAQTLFGGAGGYFLLAARAGQCRRRWMDRMLFAALCVVAGFLRLGGRLDNEPRIGVGTCSRAPTAEN